MTIPGQGTYDYHYNGHGDVVQLTNQQQQIVARYTYDAWGNIVSSSGNLANTNPYRYAGYRYDNETNLYYLHARYYDPSLMRFISQDDVPFSNLYIYSHNNPVAFVEHNGNIPIPLILMAVNAYFKYKSIKEDPSLSNIALELMPGGKFLKLGSRALKKLGFAKLGKGKQKKGTPGNNHAQNKQVNDIVNKHQLTKEQRRKLHDEISGQNYGYHEIDEIAKEIKAGRW